LSLRALVLDIDGTLIGSDKRVPELSKREIRRVHETCGVEVVIATARGLDSAKIVAMELDTPCSFIAFGGAVIESGRNGSLFFDQKIFESDTVDHLTGAADGLDVYVAVHSLSSCVINRFDYWARREVRNTSVWPEVAPQLSGRAVLPNRGISKVMFRGSGRDLDTIASRIGNAKSAYAHRTGGVLEVVPSARLKLAAMQELLGHLGINAEEAVAFGDSLADVAMLEAAGVGVLMANAPTHLEVSDRIVRTLSNDEDGIAVVLREFFPTGQPFHIF